MVDCLNLFVGKYDNFRLPGYIWEYPYILKTSKVSEVFLFKISILNYPVTPLNCGLNIFDNLIVVISLK